REIDVKLPEVGQGHDRHARAQKLPELDLAHPETAREWCADQLLGDDRLGLGDLSARLFELRLVLVDRRLRRDLALRQVLRTLQRDPRPALLRLVIGEIAAL